MKAGADGGGMNRTGIGTSPMDSKELIEVARQAPPSANGDEFEIAELRQEYASDSFPIGTMPPPSSLKGVAKAAVDLIKGQRPTVFLDKLGERLAFERTGTRLYEALLAKFDAVGGWAEGPTRQDLTDIHDEEVRHFALLRDAIQSLGADPTVMTPSADVTAVESMGLLQVLSDPRTSLSQALHAVLLAELADSTSWALLCDLARSLGHEELAAKFDIAAARELRHLEKVRGWVSNALQMDAKRELMERAPSFS